MAIMTSARSNRLWLPTALTIILFVPMASAEVVIEWVALGSEGPPALWWVLAAQIVPCLWIHLDPDVEHAARLE